jgi:hypothetical protein
MALGIPRIGLESMKNLTNPTRDIGATETVIPR